MSGQCEVCGFRIPLVKYAMTWLLSMGYDGPNHKAPRWPDRRNLYRRCPECSFWLMLVQEVSGRGATVVEYL